MREFTAQRRKAGLQVPWSPEPICLAQLTLESVGNREKLLGAWGLPGSPDGRHSVSISTLVPFSPYFLTLTSEKAVPLLGRDYERGFVFK